MVDDMHSADCQLHFLQQKVSLLLPRTNRWKTDQREPPGSKGNSVARAATEATARASVFARNWLAAIRCCGCLQCTVALMLSMLCAAASFSASRRCCSDLSITASLVSTTLGIGLEGTSSTAATG